MEFQPSDGRQRDLTMGMRARWVRCTGEKGGQGQGRFRSGPLELGNGRSRSVDGEGRYQRSWAYRVQSIPWDLNDGRYGMDFSAK